MFISGGLLCLFAIISSISRRFRESLEVKLPTIWTDGKQRWERVRGKKMQVREKVEKSRFTVFFSMDLWLRSVEK